VSWPKINKIKCNISRIKKVKMQCYFKNKKDKALKNLRQTKIAKASLIINKWKR
jgi:hypothetical protein